MTTLQDRQEELRTTSPPATNHSTRRGLVLVLVAVLALVLGGVGGWMIRGDDASTSDVVLAGGGDLTARQEQMLDLVRDAEEAWQAGDVDAVLAMFAPNGRFEAFDAVYRVSDGSLASYIERGEWGSLGVYEPVLVRDDTMLTFHEFGGRLYSEEFTFTPDGELLIVSHVIHT